MSFAPIAQQRIHDSLRYTSQNTNHVPASSHVSRNAAATSASVACLQDRHALPHSNRSTAIATCTDRHEITTLVHAMARSTRRRAVAGYVTAMYLFVVHGADAKASRTSLAGENLGLVSNEEIDKKRRKANFRRAHDGHVAIMNKYTKQWTDVKCDLQVPGLLLLREESGQVYYIGYAGLKQVDLSDDQVVAAIAADDWENNMKLVQAQAPDGTVEALELTREAFFQLVSLVSDEAQAAPMAEAAASRPANKRR